MKAQPEITVKHFRQIMHTYALLQIHRAIASGMSSFKTILLCLFDYSGFILMQEHMFSAGTFRGQGM
jgi:hypothetical protein